MILETTFILQTTTHVGDEFTINAEFGGAVHVSSFGGPGGESIPFFFRMLGGDTLTYSLHSLEGIGFEAIPEPSTGLLIAAGLAAIMLGMRRRE